MRGCAGALALLLLAGAYPAHAQQRPRIILKPTVRLERFRISINAGQQAITRPFTEEQQFHEYFEQGSFTLERAVPTALFYEAGAAVRVWRRLHAGAAVSFFENAGQGEFTARVPHPLYFNQQRTVNSEISNITRREVAQHVAVGWAIPALRRLDVLVFGGPSFFMTQQKFVTELLVSLDKEVYPFDALTFPGAATETLRQNILGYNAGADVTWRFARYAGAGVIVRYSKGKRNFTPTGGTAVEVEVGGLHAGGGLRLTF